MEVENNRINIAPGSTFLCLCYGFDGNRKQISEVFGMHPKYGFVYVIQGKVDLRIS